MSRTCGGCVHFNVSQCRRFPPKMLDGGYRQWPTMHASDPACGEWHRAPDTAPVVVVHDGMRAPAPETREAAQQYMAALDWALLHTPVSKENESYIEKLVREISRLRIVVTVGLHSEVAA